MSGGHSRHIHFESVPNFRDLGGYRTPDGRTVAWRRLFRSAALHKMNDREMAGLGQDIGPRTVIDLRGPRDPATDPEAIRLKAIGARYHSLPFSTWPWPDPSNEAKANPSPTNLGEIYFHRVREKVSGARLIEALEIIAEPENHPLVFHCSAGKDRTGVLAAMVLIAIGIVDDDVVEDYTLSAPLIQDIRDRMTSDPDTGPSVRDLPDFQWEASAESMTGFLSLLRREYGSADDYLKTNGADRSLVDRLRAALLVSRKD